MGPLIFSVVVAVITTELITRFIFRRGEYYVWTPSSLEWIEPDRATHPQLERRIRFQVSGDGERGDEAPKGSDVFRILAVGGSAVECYLLDQATSWPELVAHKLASRPELVPQKKRYLVGNIGKSGVDSLTLDYILEKTLRRYSKLDLIVVMVGASDVLRWMEQGAAAGTVAETLTVDQCFHRHPEQSFGLHPRTLAVTELIRRIRSRRPTTRTNAVRWYKRARDMRARAKVVHESTGDPSAVMSQFERAFRSVLHRAQSSAERVIVVRQPWFEKETYLPEEEALFWNGGIGKAFKEEITEYFSSKALCTLMGEIDRRAAAISDDMGIRHLDLRGVLKPSAEHYIDHFHFTPAGSEAVAEAVSDAIAEEYQSPQRASPLP